MAYIKILPDDVTDRLRAGEVVERPASVLKELVENSLDAGASRIEAEVVQGGKKLVSLRDDGHGMDSADALLSLERHSTSKLASLEDLHRITTMGFRGEALASIASVSRLTLTTAPKGSKEGVVVEAEGGRVVSTRPAAVLGTSVEVRDIFYNTPARRKFQRTDATETLHIINVLTRHALAHPATGFALKVNGVENMNIPPASDERERIAQIYGAEFLEGLRETQVIGAEGLALKAFFSRPGNLRATKSHQFIFINGRPVRDPSLAHAACAHFEAGSSGRHPIFFLFLDIDPRAVDVNVHPQKSEVRLLDKEAIYRLVRRAVSPNTVPEDEIAHGAPPSIVGAAGVSFSPETAFSGEGALGISESLPLEYEKAEPFTFMRLGEMFYAISGGAGVMLLDHHAAHERVLYERLMAGPALSPARALLFPEQIKLPPAEYRVICGHLGLLRGLGIEVEDFGRGSVLLRALPEGLFEAEHQGILMDAAGELLEGKRPSDEMKRRLAARLACHGSVRGNMALEAAGLRALLDDLDACREPERCPHGRPTRIMLSLDELKRMFKRK